MPRFIREAHEINTDWLVEVLGIPDILSFEAAQHHLNTADAIVIQVEYAQKDAHKPDKLFLKIGRRYSEVLFFNRIVPEMSETPLVRCHHAAFNDREGWGNLLFDDIGGTHANLPERLPPSAAQLRQFAGLLASVHRTWWKRTRWRLVILQNKSRMCRLCI
jgi:hypothetical protein